MRHHVLAALRVCDGYVSGQELSRQLGISRVAVWKHVRALTAQGYRVDVTPRGYRLDGCPDLLLPTEFPGWEERVHHFTVADSTMLPARALAREGAVEGTVVIAEQQSRGRGRLERSWLSPLGGVYMTVVTRPAIAPALASRISLLVAVVVADSIERLHGLPARVKWPNDVLIDGKKVCGILAEMEAESDAVRFVNVGIGLNANSAISELQEGAVSLRDLRGAPVDRVPLARAIIEGILAGLPMLGDALVLDEWRARTVTIGREVSVMAGGSPVSGRALDITASGALLVRDPEGKVHEVIAGDCVQAGE